MNFEKILKISASGLRANRAWMTVVASNLANMNTTRTNDGKPYRRRTIIFEAVPVEDDQFRTMLRREKESLQMVKVADVIPDGRDFKKVYDPTHPDADKDGFVLVPNINPVEEMANLLEASKAYEANLAVFESTRQLAIKALELGK